MKILIIDDENDARLVIKSLINADIDVNEIYEAGGIQEAVASINLHSPDLVFLDIQLKNGTGFDLLNAFPNRDFHVIFTTGHDEHALQAFKYSAVDYLLKPIDKDDFQKALNKVKQSSNLIDINARLSHLEKLVTSNNITKIAFPCQEGTIYLELMDIVRLESDGNYTTIHTSNDKKIVVSRIIKEYEEILPSKYFFRTHKSHIVNIQNIVKFIRSDESVELKNGVIIPVARRRKEELLGLIG